MASTGKVRIKFDGSGHTGAFVASDGNGTPWLVVFSSNGSQKLGSVEVRYEGDRSYLLTVAQWSEMTVLPFTGIISIVDAQLLAAFPIPAP